MQQLLGEVPCGSLQWHCTDHPALLLKACNFTEAALVQLKDIQTACLGRSYTQDLRARVHSHLTDLFLNFEATSLEADRQETMSALLAATKAVGDHDLGRQVVFMDAACRVDLALADWSAKWNGAASAEDRLPQRCQTFL